MTYKAGYCVTDEPGFYKDGEFGIRIENALYVAKANPKYTISDSIKFYKVLSLRARAPIFYFGVFHVKMSKISRHSWAHYIIRYNRPIREPLLYRLDNCFSGGFSSIELYIRVTSVL